MPRKKTTTIKVGRDAGTGRFNFCKESPAAEKDCDSPDYKAES